MSLRLSGITFRRVKIPAGFMAAVVFQLTLGASFTQIGEANLPPDAPTRTADEKGIFCTVESMKVVRKAGLKGAKYVSIVFSLTKNPSVYFHYYDPGKKAIVFDFYDCLLGRNALDTIEEHPITGSAVEFSRIDLNQKVKGLQSDFREVVRVSLFTPEDFEYDVVKDQGVITMSYKQNRRKRGFWKFW